MENDKLKQQMETEDQKKGDNKRKIAEKKIPSAMGWGPILAERRSTRARGTGNVLEKAQNL